MGKRTRLWRWTLMACLGGANTWLPAQTPLPPPPSAPSAPLASSAEQGSEPSATELLGQAGQALDAGRLPQAQALLDRVKASSPTQPGLWGMYGLLQLRADDKSAAVLDFQKELSLHPQATQAYIPLVGTLLQLQRRPEALRALRAWNVTALDDPRPVGLLINLWLDEGDAEAALRAAKDGLAHLPERARNDPQLQYAAGVAELQAGDKTNGAKRLLTLLPQVEDPSLRNSIAYALADAGVELPTAEATERQVLARLELESEGWSLASAPQALRFGTPLLVAAWDTLGWILFREGKLAEAEPFVRASWRNEPRSLIGEHLSEIEAARGEHAAALADLQTAIAASKAESDQGKTAHIALAAMEKRRQALSTTNTGATEHAMGTATATGTPAPVGSASLQRLVRYNLGAAGGRNGSVLYTVLISRGRITAASPAGGASPDAKPLPASQALLAHADLGGLFPTAGSYVQLMHRASVTCSPKGCELLLQP